MASIQQQLTETEARLAEASSRFTDARREWKDAGEWADGLCRAFRL
jgi:hypothetical protein